MLLHNLSQFFVDVLNRFHGAVITQYLFYQLLECFFLAVRRQWYRTSQHLINKIIFQISSILGVIQCAVNICAAVIKRGEQKSSIRHPYHPVTETVLKGILFCVITQTGLGQIYRADACQYVLVHLIGSILHLCTILSASRHIVGIVDQ